MAEQRPIMCRFSRGTRAFGLRGTSPANGRTRGFTLVELVVVLGMIAILATLALAAWRQGLFREYAQTAQIRALTNALHLAQWRALKGNIAIPIAQGQSVDFSNGWYHKVEITTVFPHSFKVGDWVSFSDIASLPPGAIGHSGLNVGRYCITDVEMTTPPMRFRVSYYSQVAPAINDIPQSPPYPAPPPVPMVRNATGASKLVLIKKSKIKELLGTLGTSDVAAITENQQNFVYDDAHTFIWGYTAGGFGNPEVFGVPTDLEYTLTVRFNSRGLPADPAGYQLAVGNDPSEFGAARPRKIITIAPTGKINPGAS